MTSINTNRREWPTWHPISGGPANVDKNHRGDPEDGLPVIATNGRGEFVRCDVLGWWYRCDANGDANGELMPGLFKLRTHLGKGTMYTQVCAPLSVYEIPGVGVPFQRITSIWEHSSGDTKIGDTWHMASGFTITTDDQGVQHITPPEHWNIPQQ